MNLEKYMLRLEHYLPDLDLAPVVKAYSYMVDAHRGQFRKSGEPYMIHPVDVSLILAELQMDVPTIVAGLLHDVVEDTDITLAEIDREFGSDVALLVDGVTKLGKIHYETKQQAQAENLRKMFLAMAQDIRVILIKLADRLHNMRTLKYMTDAKKKEKASESLEIYAPIAHRLGISRIKWELEDLSLLYLDPEGYYELVDRVSKKRKEREYFIKKVIDDLYRSTKEIGVSCEIYGRPKNFYSIYKKMKHQHKEFDQIYDLTAMRVLVDSIKDCYGVLGAVHNSWTPIPGRFKDYIAVPKNNMYQSLHTTVIGDGGEPFEIQIRTYEMHKVAEYGIAAHWKYKEGNMGNAQPSDISKMDTKLAWLRQMMEWQRDLENPEEFMNSLKFDLFNNQVYVFSPKGQIYELPVGSTPVDFAYKVHSEVGNQCVGAKINNRIVPLSIELKTGQILEILTSKSSTGPSLDWLNFVKSTQAKNKIKHWFKKERREDNISIGKDMLEKDIKKNGLKWKDLMKTEWTDPLLKRLSLSSLDDLYAAIGYGGILLSQVVPRLKGLYREQQNELRKMQEAQNVATKLKVDERIKNNKNNSQSVIVQGIDSALVRMASCCRPVLGDDIIGFVTRGRGVTVHRADCNNFEKTDDVANRFVEVSWNQGKLSKYLCDIQILVPDRQQLLSEVTVFIGTLSSDVIAINAKVGDHNVAIIHLTVKVSSTFEVDNMIKTLKNLPDVIDVNRVRS